MEKQKSNLVQMDSSKKVDVKRLGTDIEMGSKEFLDELRDLLKKWIIWKMGVVWLSWSWEWFDILKTNWHTLRVWTKSENWEMNSSFQDYLHWNQVGVKFVTSISLQERKEFKSYAEATPFKQKTPEKETIFSANPIIVHPDVFTSWFTTWKINFDDEEFDITWKNLQSMSLSWTFFWTEFMKKVGDKKYSLQYYLPGNQIFNYFHLGKWSDIMVTFRIESKDWVTKTLVSSLSLAQLKLIPPTTNPINPRYLNH